MYDAMLAETISIPGAGGDRIEAYLARPLGPGPYGGVVVIHHMPGYDESTKEMVRRFAANGFAAVCPNLYSREAPGASPDDAAATVRAAGGVPDDRMVGDVEAAAAYLRGLTSATGRVGVIGHCSGGRHAFLAACRLPLDAAVDCYGAFVVGDPPDNFPLAVTPVVGEAGKLSCPLLGLFGAEDRYPSTEQNAELERVLTDLGKTFEFHTYPDAGHAFFSVDRPSYRPQAAVDGWRRILAFFDRHLNA
ncbi:dienelactone hydrolase family protein [Micromonospora zhanjiangensis]|uniref:Dienelactone hydrolase family protein n=1 Tax=Micromonospora zhanjiangensis TaxID=1522057 RepID=A0ABV8KQX8_9ACTN